MPIVLAIILLPFLFIGIWALVYLLPVTNKLFSMIWMDPTERQRQEILVRLKEHHVDGGVPEETAVLMAAKEFSTTEKNLLKAAELFSAADVKALLTGKRNVLDVGLGHVVKHMRKNAGGPKKVVRRIRPQVDETPGSVEDSIDEEGGI
jgi:hypothetical protein